jgi:hypothetical protein
LIVDLRSLLLGNVVEFVDLRSGYGYYWKWVSRKLNEWLVNVIYV